MVNGMNSDTMLAIEECAKEAGALISCPICVQLISANDEDAERTAYALATNAWKDGPRGFRGMARIEVMDLMKQVLQRSTDCDCSAIACNH
jgi:hypothetical protein